MKRPSFSPRLTLTTQTLFIALGSIVTFLVVLLLFLIFGTNQLLKTWHSSETNALDAFLQTQLRSLYIEGMTPIAFTPEQTARALEGIPYNPEWVVVTDGQGMLLFFWRKAGSGAAPLGQGKTLLRRIQDITEWSEIRASNGTLLFKYSAFIPEFQDNTSNQALLHATKTIALFALVLSPILAFFFAYFFAKPLQRQSKELVRTLTAIANGEREMALPKCSVQEFESIAEAADVLQKNIFREESIRHQWMQDIAHDLRTPVTVLKGQLEGMIEGVFPKDSIRISKAAKEVSRLEDLIKGLSLLSKIETPGFSIKKESIQLDFFLTEIAERFLDNAATSGISISTEVAPIQLDADPHLLTRAISNLITNAIQYGINKIVHITVQKDPITCEILLKIENEGIIDDAILPQIFDRLFRGDPSREKDGSGLGLAITKAIVEAHGATISVYVDRKKYTTCFALSFI